MKTATQISGAVWCDPAKYPQWKTLPNSFFDYRKRSSEWTPALLEFRFFYEWDGASSCLIRFSAGCRFRLLLNGEFLEDGPVEPGGDYGKTDSPDWWFSDSMEITSRLQPGRNEFRFQVCPVPVVQSDYSTGSGWVWCMIDDGNGWHLPGEWQFKISKSYSLFVWVMTFRNRVIARRTLVRRGNAAIKAREKSACAFCRAVAVKSRQRRINLLHP